tara:strand:+ start:452 stop:691 length:240 start_codon:yes stop_codon:yes gene_type:complete
VAYTNFSLNEILLGITVFDYVTQKDRYNTQTDLVVVADSWLFTAYKRVIFLVFLGIEYFGEMLVGRYVKGQCLNNCWRE